jgi:hypothetical protein
VRPELKPQYSQQQQKKTLKTLAARELFLARKRDLCLGINYSFECETKKWALTLVYLSGKKS